MGSYPQPAGGLRRAGGAPGARERLRALTAANLEALETVLRWNVEHGIELFRLSSDTIPFASHPVNDLAWWDENRTALERIGSLIGHQPHGLSHLARPGRSGLLSSLSVGQGRS